MRLKLPFIFAFVLVFFTTTTVLKAQEEQGKTYVIIDKGSVKDVQPYVAALNAADMKYHRLRDKRYTIIFDTGVEVQLFSASECKANGRTIILENYPFDFDSRRQEPVFSLGQNNYILEAHKPSVKTKK